MGVACFRVRRRSRICACLIRHACGLVWDDKSSTSFEGNKLGYDVWLVQVGVNVKVERWSCGWLGCDEGAGECGGVGIGRVCVGGVCAQVWALVVGGAAWIGRADK